MANKEGLVETIFETIIDKATFGYMKRPSDEVVNRSYYLEQAAKKARAQEDADLIVTANNAEATREELQKYASNLSRGDFDAQFKVLNSANYDKALLAAKAEGQVTTKIFQPNKFLREADTINAMREEYLKQDEEERKAVKERIENEAADQERKERANRDWSEILNG